MNITEDIMKAIIPDSEIATPNDCFEYRAKKFQEKYGCLAPGKDSREEKPDNLMELWKDFGRYVPCICGKKIP